MRRGGDTIFPLSIDRNEAPTRDIFQWRATIEVFIPFFKTAAFFPYPVSSLSEFYTFSARTIFGCYILKFQSSRQKLIPSASFHGQIMLMLIYIIPL